MLDKTSVKNNGTIWNVLEITFVKYVENDLRWK